MTQEDKIINNEGEGDTLFKALVSVSLKTVFYLFLFISVFVTYLCLHLPYRAMNLCSDLGLYSHSLVFCERAVNLEKNAERRTECFINGIELSDKLLNDTLKNTKKNQKYAEKLIYFTESYAFCDSFDKTNKNLDAYYLREIQNMKDISLYNSLSFYSYKDYVYCLNQKARAVLNKTDKFLISAPNGTGSLTPIEELSDEIFKGLAGGVFSFTDIAIFFNQIAETISINKEAALFLLDGGDLFSLIKDIMPDYLRRVFQTEDALEKLYLLKTAFNLEQALSETGRKTDFKIEIDEDEITIRDYLLEQLAAYGGK